VGFKQKPEDAVPTDKVKDLISRLAGNSRIVLTVVSGRSVDNLLEFFKGMDTEYINWSGVHGGQVKFAGCDIEVADMVKKALPYMKELKGKISGMVKDIPCYIVEDKGFSLALHYRRCSEGELEPLEEINGFLAEYVEDRPLELMYMKKVVEIKPAGINKGNSIEIVNERYFKDITSVNICIGDDLTDEYLFCSNREGINITVGENKEFESAAGYFLKDISQVHNFLERLASI